MVALLVVVKRNRVALNMSVNVRARTIVIATELFAGHLQADVTAIAVVVEGVLPTISTTGEASTCASPKIDPTVNQQLGTRRNIVTAEAPLAPDRVLAKHRSQRDAGGDGLFEKVPLPAA